MISPRWAGAFASVLFLASTPAFAAAYITFDGVQGESTKKGASAQGIEVHSWSWGATQAGIGHSGGGGGGAGKVSMRAASGAAAQPASSVQSRDEASAQATGRRSAPAADVDGDARPDVAAVREVSVSLPEADAKPVCATGKRIRKASLSDGGETVELSNVVVTSCTTQAGVSTVTLRGHQRSGHVTLMK